MRGSVRKGVAGVALFAVLPTGCATIAASGGPDRGGGRREPGGHCRRHHWRGVLVGGLVGNLLDERDSPRLEEIQAYIRRPNK